MDRKKIPAPRENYPVPDATHFLDLRTRLSPELSKTCPSDLNWVGVAWSAVPRLSFVCSGCMEGVKKKIFQEREGRQGEKKIVCITLAGPKARIEMQRAGKFPGILETFHGKFREF